MEENASIGGKSLQPPADLRQLRYFVTIAEAGSFTAAAAQLHVAQQSLSQQIALIERRLGAALFDRGPHGVTPTPSASRCCPRRGRRWRPRIVPSMSPAGPRRDERLKLRIGFLSSVANHLLPPVVRGLSSEAPDLAIDTEELPIAQLVARLRDGTLDAGLSRPPLVDDLADRGDHA